MDALQAISSATEIVSSMIGVVGALEQASRDLNEAPTRIRSLEEFVSELENLTRRVKQKHAYKLHNSQLYQQMQSMNGLIEKLHPNIQKASKIVSRSKGKSFAKVKNLVWNSMVGDPLSKLVTSIRNDLNWWLEFQQLAENVEKVLDLTAKNVPVQLRINSEQGYPVLNKCHFVRSLLEGESSHRVVLIVGLSGIGKSCLARQVASEPPAKFIHGAVELGFGQWCSRAACNGCRDEYRKRLARKICKFLVLIGFWKKIKDENSEDLEIVCCLLQEALFSKSMLILLEDVWEQDIVERFVKLYDNDCRFLVTTRNEAVYEITEAEKVEICKEDVRETSKTILLYHSQLDELQLPSIADSLLESCGHHPLTVAVMGKTLRKETRVEKWENAIRDLSTYAESAPGPISYVNEKDVENTLTIFGSFEFSLEAMPLDPRRLFLALAALSWVESMPEACLEALWSILGKESLFPLIVCKLVEGSLLMKADSYPMYQVHDMVSLYLVGKTSDALNILLTRSAPESVASVAPWLFVFGKENVKMIAQQNIKSFLDVLEENLIVITLNSTIQALMASKSISELEASRVRFSKLLGPRIEDLISIGSPHLVAGCANVVANIFNKNDYIEYMKSLETVSAVNKLAGVSENCDDLVVQTNICAVLAKLAEYGSPETIDKVLQCIPINRLAGLLVPSAEEWHESVFSTLMSLINSGRSRAIEKMFASGVDQNLIRLLENGSEVAQYHAIVTLKTFYELGGPLAKRSIRPATLNLLPWQARLSLEKFVLSDRNIPISPKPQTFDDLIQKIFDKDQKHVLEAMQDIILIIEKAGEPRILDMIIQAQLIGRLVELLQYGQSERNSIRSVSAFLLMKLACSGGEPCVSKLLEFQIVSELVKMMQSNTEELQDAAYTTLHQMLFGQGGHLVTSHIVQNGFLDKLVHSIESKSIKTREVCINCLLDLVEVGNKVCIERIFYLQVVEKLAKIEKINGGSGKLLVRLLEGMNKSKHITTTERKVMKQHLLRKVRAIMRGHKHEVQVVSAVETSIAEGSRGASSSRKQK